MTTLIEYERALASVLQEHGVSVYRVENGGKHKKLCFHFEGQDIRFIIPASASDWRGLENSKSDLRKVMGVKRPIRKNPENRQRRKPAATLTMPDCPHITTKPDPFEPLRAMEVEPTPEDYALEALIDRAGREQVFLEVLSGGWGAHSVVPHQVWRDAAEAVLTRSQRGVHGDTGNA